MTTNQMTIIARTAAELRRGHVDNYAAQRLANDLIALLQPTLRRYSDEDGISTTIRDILYA